MRKPGALKPRKSVHPKRDTPKALTTNKKRVFGSAMGQIILEKGWDAPMTERELDDFLSGDP